MIPEYDLERLLAGPGVSVAPKRYTGVAFLAERE